MEYTKACLSVLLLYLLSLKYQHLYSLRLISPFTFILYYYYIYTCILLLYYIKAGYLHSNLCFSNIIKNEVTLTSVSQEMAVRALKQTGSRNIEAALEYISKMGYLDPRNELIVRVIKQTSPGTWNLLQ